MIRFWPSQEHSQAEYERLRSQVLLGVEELDLAASRFRKLGLAALISLPTPTSPMIASVLGGRRPRWSGLEDPRLAALADTYSLLMREALDTTDPDLLRMRAASASGERP